MAQVDITPIQEEHLREVGEFLNVHLNSKFSADAWIQSLTHPWSATRPNYGAQLRDGAKLVGVHCAIYSDQTIEGRVEKFCNPHTWCVLGDYRNHGIGLVLYLIKQRGYHFTMLTPNPKVAEIFRKLKFKDLDTGIAVFFNLPTLRIRREVIVESDKASIAQYLPPAVRRDYELHREIPWLRFLAFGRGEDVCLVVYKTDRWKRMSCARIIHVSDPAVFDRYLPLMRHHLMMREKLVVSRIETRFMQKGPWPVYRMVRTQGKLKLSPTLRDSQIADLYSELASLDI